MLPSEDPYGAGKRFQFIKEIIDQFKPGSVLDIGCGIGNVAFRLASCFQQSQFIGVDNDPASIEFARQHNTMANLVFRCPRDLHPDEKFDLIIASEVIEHVDNPKEFLLSLRNRLSDGGRLVVTLPNGYGPFEIMSLIEVLLQLSGVLKVLGNLKRTLQASTPKPGEHRDTLAVSPHINFFSYGGIRRLIEMVGFNVLRYRPRMFLCGFIFDQLLQGKRIIAWNANIADCLPPHFSSDWMFLLEKGQFSETAGFKPGICARFHRYLNKKQCGLV